MRVNSCCRVDRLDTGNLWLPIDVYKFFIGDECVCTKYCIVSADEIIGIHDTYDAAYFNLVLSGKFESEDSV